MTDLKSVLTYILDARIRPCTILSMNRIDDELQKTAEDEQNYGVFHHTEVEISNLRQTHTA